MLRLWRTIATRTSLTLSLLLIAMLSLSIGLSTSIQGATTSLFMSVAVISVLLTWLLADSPLPTRWAWTATLVAGVIVILLWVGHLSSPLGALFGQLPGLATGLYRWSWFDVGPDPGAFVTAWQDLITQTGVLLSRLGGWTNSLLTGKSNDDPVARIVAWSFTIWLLSSWAAWFVRRRKQVFVGLLPGTALLAYILYYTASEPASLWSNTACLLLLMGDVHLEDRWRTWHKQRIDFVESVPTEMAIATILLALVLTVSASYLPTLTVEKITDYFRELTQPPPQETTNESLGLEAGNEPGVPAGAGSTYEYNKRPYHTIGTPPSLGREVMFTVRTGDLPPLPGQVFNMQPKHYYWRTDVYDNYTGLGWTSSAFRKQEEAPYAFADVENPVLPEGYRMVNQDIRYISDLGDQLVWTGVLVQTDQPYLADWRWRPYPKATPYDDPLSAAEMLRGQMNAEEYRAVSLLAEPTVEQLRAASGDYPDWIRERYLALPDTVPERVLGLARDLTATAATPFDRAQAIETYLRQIPYSLDVPGPSKQKDIAEYFLFDLKEGYCDYYATTMVVLARAAGLPARFVIGYSSGGYDTVNAQYVVLASNAHSWPEIYFSDIGWVEFEPTGNQPEIMRHNESGQIVAPYTPPTPEPKVSLSEQIGSWLPQTLTVLMWISLALIAALLAWILGQQWLTARLSPQRAIERTYRQVYRASRPLTGHIPATRTPLEHAAGLGSRLEMLSQQGRLATVIAGSLPELHSLTEIYVRSQYSAHAPNRSQARQAIRLWGRLRWRLWLARLAQSLQKKKR